MIVLSVAIIKFKEKQVVRANTRRKYGLMNWNDTTGVSFKFWSSFNKKTVLNIHFPISFQVQIKSSSRPPDKPTSASGVFVKY